MEQVNELCYWITERENIRVQKDAGYLKPWSQDPVFQTTYFCNVHREDDKVTRWIRENWKYEGDNLRDEYELAMCIARWVNWPDTLKHFKYPLSLANVGHMMKSLRFDGRKVWGSAYVVTTHGKRMDKVDWLLEAARGASDYLPIPMHAPTLAAAHAHLTQVDGLASFMAGQIVADLKNTEGHPLFKAEDWMTWSAPGPGSLRGLGWVYGHPVSARDYEGYMEELHPVVAEKVPSIVMCRQDLQNCLCEFDKYMRVKHGTGRSKRKYNGV